MSGFSNEAEGYAASLRQMAEWHRWNGDPDELVAAAEFIEHQQAMIENLKRDFAGT